jgi:DNA-binding MarR family transcriptional regulator
MQDDERRLPGEGVPQTLFSLVWDVERCIRRHFRGTNLHWGLRRILQRLWLQDGLSQVELSDAVGSSEGSISNMLKHLVAGGWVERRQDDYDYRISRVHLTDQGAALRDAIAGELQQMDKALRTELGEADTQRLESLLERAGDALRAAAPDEEEARFQSLADHPSPPGEL